ncbi:hypothetical protein Hypma_014491 [Hypsizygus marmoreus]|uniref:Uncharacterized protein n=1 Tax=Hypsizygus marmoreus TaxID=39966 RepID=A0A369JEH0_HYPMA|nr:hypothetical protein Hypma_014491 [Hypsizygus marmoreus]
MRVTLHTRLRLLPILIVYGLSAVMGAIREFGPLHPSWCIMGGSARKEYDMCKGRRETPPIRPFQMTTPRAQWFFTKVRSAWLSFYVLDFGRRPEAETVHIDMVGPVTSRDIDCGIRSGADLLGTGPSVDTLTDTLKRMVQRERSGLVLRHPGSMLTLDVLLLAIKCHSFRSRLDIHSLTKPYAGKNPLLSVLNPPFQAVVPDNS